MKRLITIWVVIVVMVILARTAPAVDTFGYSVQSDGDDNLYRINLNTGDATPIGPVGHDDLEGLSFQPGTGVLFGGNNWLDEVLVTINTTTGAATTVGELFLGQGDVITNLGLGFCNDGSLWMATMWPGDFYSVDPTTGLATSIGPQGIDVTGLACWDGVMYGLGGDHADNLVTIDLSTGAATNVGPLVNVSLFQGGIAFAPDGTLWGIEEEGTIFTINPSTGYATVVATTLDDFESLAIVPEPATVSLLGLGALALLRRRK